MDFDKYQKDAGSTAIYPCRGNNQLYPLLGLVDEVGEVVDKWSTVADYGTDALFNMAALVGKVAGIFKKTIRDGNGVVTDASRDEIARIAHNIRSTNEALLASVCDEKRLELGAGNMDASPEMKKEFGDVLWYLQQCCAEFGFSFDSVACDNLSKLKSRQERGVLQGSGDNR